MERKLSVVREDSSDGVTTTTENNVRPVSVNRPTRFMNHRARPGQAYIPTDVEHIANVVTHALWIAPSLVGLLWMLHLAASSAQFLSSAVYGGALIALFFTSTSFHVLSYTGKFIGLKNFFHIGDRAVIYIFIAASYTPWLALKELYGWGAVMLCVVWVLALCGIWYQYTFHEQYKWLETVFYVAIGVCPSVVVMGMKDSSGSFEMALGGAVYIGGVFFFKCDGLIPFAHAIWHCFVSAGAVFHYCAVCRHLLGSQDGVIST